METIKDKIVNILNCGSESWEYLYQETLSEAAKEIEKLILSEKICLARRIATSYCLDTKREFEIKQDKIIEQLTTELNKLKDDNN